MAFVCPENLIEFPDLMVDIETLATTPNAAIIAICAVPFNANIGNTDLQYFYEEINHDSLELFDHCENTITWWSQQTMPMPKGTTSIKTALKSLEEYLKKQPYQTIWANSPSFDLVILKNAFSKFNLTWPIPYWAEQDVRTARHIAKLPKITNSHHAYKDCINQIQTVV